MSCTKKDVGMGLFVQCFYALSLHLVSVVFCTAIPTSLYIFGKCFIYLYTCICDKYIVYQKQLIYCTKLHVNIMRCFADSKFSLKLWLHPHQYTIMNQLRKDRNSIVNNLILYCGLHVHVTIFSAEHQQHWTHSRQSIQ